MANRNKGQAAATDSGGGRERDRSGGRRDTSVSREKGKGVAPALSDGSGGSLTVSGRGGGTAGSGGRGTTESAGRGTTGSGGRRTTGSRGRGAVGSHGRSTVVGSRGKETAGVPSSTDAGSFGSKRRAAFPVDSGGGSKRTGVEPTPVLLHPTAVYMVALMFDWDNGKLGRVIPGILRDKFDGPYYSWKVTPRHVQERIFRTFARMYHWDVGLTPTVRKHFLAIAKKRLRGITPEAQDKSDTASQCCNSDRGGLGITKQVSGQKSYLRVQQEMEEEFGRPVSWGEVFQRTHTKPDGTFVDFKAQQVHEAYEKQLNEAMPEEDLQGSGILGNSSQRSTQRTLTIEEKNEIFCKCTQTDPKGIIFGLGELPLMVDSKKGKESFASSTVPELSLIQDQLQEAQRKIDAQEEENARRDEEHCKAQEKISEMSKFLRYLKNKDPLSAEYMDKQDEQENNLTDAPASAQDKEPGSTPLDPPAPATA
ncbi:unnamed protein product [Arabis nemorensis]|uniref:Uncharacterized protein n=1 Tax=Arabis nemorensis TaxID=586526 RepID=A0A565BTF9_9BRAS|nr:unnamed protein product [Arabis nemorensis]